MDPIHMERRRLDKEFPVEILRLIRDFSKPLYPHYQLYTQTLRSVRLTHWPHLKERLYEERTRTLVQEYLIAYQARIHPLVERENIQIESVFEGKHLKQQLVRKQYREQETFRELSIHLYGEWRILLDIRRDLENNL